MAHPAPAPRRHRGSVSRRVNIGLVTSGRPDNHGGCGSAQHIPQRIAQRIGVALDDLGVRIAVAQQRAETVIIFDQYETLLIDAVLDQRAGDRTGAGSKFDDRLRGIDIDILAPWCAPTCVPTA